MKLNFLKTFFLSALLVTAISCKDNTKEATTTDAQEAAEKTAVAIDYNVDVETSQIDWKGSKPLGSHNGTIALASGTFSVNDGTIEAGKFSIDMNSITDLDLEGTLESSLDDLFGNDDLTDDLFG